MEKTASLAQVDGGDASEGESRGTPAGQGGTVKPYSTRTWKNLSTLKLKPRVCFWGDIFALGQLHVIFGQGGLGKSRISLNLARNQVLGYLFCGKSTGPRPLKHLLMGSENSIHRLQDDVQKMSSELEPEEIAMLEANIHLATLEGPEDAFINLGDTHNVNRWTETVAQTKPDVVWVDPWGDILIGEGTDRDVRETLVAIKKLVRRVNPEAALVVMAHARTGAHNIALAGGFGAADFGKGSKALFSAARAVVNLAPYDESDNPEIVTVCAKFNDAKKFEAFKMKLDEKTRTYAHAGTVDLELWREQVKAVGADKRHKARAMLKPKPDRNAVFKSIETLLSKGPLQQKRLIEELMGEHKLSERDATTFVRDAEKIFIESRRSNKFQSSNVCTLRSPNPDVTVQSVCTP